MKNIKAQVDTSEPFANRCDHVRNNLKKEQMLEEKYSEIDRANRILLKKMSDIMRTQPATDQEPLGPRSMNREFRKRELERITRDNQYILKRIQYAQPVLNHNQWELEHQKQTEYLKRKVEFPLVIRTPRKVPLSARLPAIDEGKKTVDAPLTDRSRRRNPTGLECVFKCILHLEDRPYVLEMSTDDRGTLYVTAHDEVTRNTLELMVNNSLHRKLLKQANGDYGPISDRLRIEAGHRLVLDEGPPMREPPATLSAPLEPTFKPSLPPQHAALEAGISGPPSTWAAPIAVCEPAVEQPWDADRLMKKSDSDAAHQEPAMGDIESIAINADRAEVTTEEADATAVAVYQPEKPLFTFARGRSSKGFGDSEEEFDNTMDVVRVMGTTAETFDVDLKAEVVLGGFEDEDDVTFRIRGLTPQSSIGTPRCFKGSR